MEDDDPIDLGFETQENLTLQNNLSRYPISITSEKEYCVGRVDMLNSNKISAIIGTEKAADYRRLFLNSMYYLLGCFNGHIIKNVENSVLFYFPKSVEKNEKPSCLRCIDCGLSMIQIHEEMSKIAKRKGLPRIDYCVSADYGRVAIIDSDESEDVDLLGPPMNYCSKISDKAPPNNFVIGKDLYERVKDCKDYIFTLLKCQIIKSENQVYKVTRNNKSVGEKVV